MLSHIAMILSKNVDVEDRNVKPWFLEYSYFFFFIYSPEILFKLLYNEISFENKMFCTNCFMLFLSCVFNYNKSWNTLRVLLFYIFFIADKKQLS